MRPPPVRRPSPIAASRPARAKPRGSRERLTGALRRALSGPKLPSRRSSRRCCSVGVAANVPSASRSNGRPCFPWACRRNLQRAGIAGAVQDGLRQREPADRRLGDTQLRRAIGRAEGVADPRAEREPLRREPRAVIHGEGETADIDAAVDPLTALRRRKGQIERRGARAIAVEEGADQGEIADLAADAAVQQPTRQELRIAGERGLRRGQFETVQRDRAIRFSR